MDFERDDAKAALNLRKHGVAFEDATQLFLDPARVDLVDDRDEYGEERWLSLGACRALVVEANSQTGQPKSDRLLGWVNPVLGGGPYRAWRQR